MDKIKKIITLYFFCFCICNSFAQELNCEVTINADQVTITNKQVFQTLQTAVKEFMNNHKWTDQSINDNKKIKCNIVIAISNYNNNEMDATMYIRSSRPVYNTAITSTLLNLKDAQIHFKYVEFQQLEYQDGVYINDLTSLLAFYAYVIIGYDYDTFSELGGNLYFNKAMSIVNSAQSSTIEGWKAMEKNTRNRYHQITEITDSKNDDFRKALYQYHRLDSI